VSVANYQSAEKVFD